MQQRGVEIQPRLALVQKQPHQRLAAQDQKRAEHQHRAQSEIELRAERVAHACIVLRTVKLRREDARSRERAEHAQREHEQQLVDNGDAAHRLRADLPHHQIVQQAHEIRDHLLDQNRDHHREHAAVKRFVPDQAPNAHGSSPFFHHDSMRQAV